MSTALTARLDGLAADVHRLARRLLGAEGLAALASGSTDGAIVDPRAISAWEASQDATRALRRLAAAAGLPPAEVEAIGADHYGKRPAAEVSDAPR